MKTTIAKARFRERASAALLLTTIAAVSVRFA